MLKSFGIHSLKCTANTYSSPRISSEYTDCSLPLTFDMYSACSFSCQYCATGDTPIYTPSGKINIEKLKIGDNVLSFNMKTQKIEMDKIKQFMTRDVKKITVITLENDKILKLTPNHLIFVEEKGWIEAGKIKEGDDIKYFKSPRVSLNMSLNNPMKKLEVRQKQGNTIRKRFASGELDWLKERISKSARKRIIEMNKTEKMRIAVSNRMKINNPMFKEEVRKKVSETEKMQYKAGRISYWLGKKRTELYKKIHSKTGKKDFISNGQQQMYDILLNNNINFIGEMELKNPENAYYGRGRPFAIDAFLPDFNIGLEYDEHWSHFTKDGIKKQKIRDNIIYKNYNIEIKRFKKLKDIKEYILRLKNES